jgi:Zn-dependent peptidase ImmA (M78 family)
MPASLVIQAFDDNNNLARLSTRFKVSREAMGWRLVNIGLLK